MSILLLASACGDELPEVVIEIDADDTVAGQVDALRVVVRGSDDDATVQLEQPLSGQPPACLPFSFSVLAESLKPGDAITVQIEGLIGGQHVFDKQVSGVLRDGLQTFGILVETTCVDATCPPNDIGVLPSATRDAILQSLAKKVCRAPPTTPGDCILADGCYAATGSACLIPCPDPGLPEPVDEPVAPEPVEPPDLADCPEGWASVDDGVARCEPWASGAYAACPGDSIRVPSRSSCVRLGAPCVGGFPVDVPMDAVYVRPGAAGDGSSANPYGTIDAALVGAPRATTFALSRGTFVSRVAALDRTIHIVGCGAESVLDFSLGAASLSIQSNVELTATAVRGAPIVVERSGSLGADGVWIDSPVTAYGPMRLSAARLTSALSVRDGTTAAVMVSFEGSLTIGGVSAALSLDDFVVRGPTSAGVVVEDSATVTIQRGVVEDVLNAGVLVDGGASMNADWIIVRDVAIGAREGIGIEASRATAVDVSHAWVENVQDTGVRIVESAPAILSNVGVRNVDPVNGAYGEGIRVELGEAAIDHVLVNDVSRVGLSLSRSQSVASHVDVSMVQRDSVRGRGLYVFESSLVADHVRIRDAESGAVRIDRSATATITHATLERTGSRDGVLVDAGGRLVLRRATIDDVSNGVQVTGDSQKSSHVVLEDVRIRDSRRNGLYLGTPTTERNAIMAVDCRRIEVVNSGLFGIVVQEAEVDLGHVTVRGTRNAVDAELGGMGFRAEPFSTIRGSHVHLEDNDEAGLLVAGGDVELSHVVSKGALCDLQRRCGFGGSGAFMSAGRLVLDRFTLENNATYGLQLRTEAPATLTNGYVRKQAVGLFANALASDLERYVRGVVFDNGVDLLVE